MSSIGYTTAEAGNYSTLDLALHYAGIIPRLSLCKEEESLVSFYMCTVSRVNMTQQCRGWTKLDSMHPTWGTIGTASEKAGEKPGNQAITSFVVTVKFPLISIQFVNAFFNFMYLRSSGVGNKSSSVAI